MRNLNQFNWKSSVLRAEIRPTYRDISISRYYYNKLWETYFVKFKNIIRYNTIDLTIKKNFSNL